MKLSPRTIAFLIAATVVLLVVFSSCKAGKDVIKTEYIRDSAVEEQLKLYVQKLTIERDNYAKKVREMEYLGILFKECPDMDSLIAAVKRSNGANLDSVLKVIDSYRSEVEVAADGAIKARGQLASVSKSKTRLEEEIKWKDIQINELRDSLATKKTDVVTKVEVKEKSVKYIPWWVYWLMPVILIIGIVTGWKFREWAANRGEAIADSMTVRGKDIKFSKPRM